MELRATRERSRAVTPGFMLMSQPKRVLTHTHTERQRVSFGSFSVWLLLRRRGGARSQTWSPCCRQAPAGSGQSRLWWRVRRQRHWERTRTKHVSTHADGCRRDGAAAGRGAQYAQARVRRARGDAHAQQSNVVKICSSEKKKKRNLARNAQRLKNVECGQKSMPLTAETRMGVLVKTAEAG